LKHSENFNETKKITKYIKKKVKNTPNLNMGFQVLYKGPIKNWDTKNKKKIPSAGTRALGKEFFKKKLKNFAECLTTDTRQRLMVGGRRHPTATFADGEICRVPRRSAKSGFAE
jgi:hypothetical protein